MSLDESDYKLFKKIANSLDDHNKLVAEQNQILIQILEQIRYLR